MRAPEAAAGRRAGTAPPPQLGAFPTVQFEAFAPGVEVNGQTVLAIINGMGAFRSRALTILEANAISDPEPGRWYSQQSWLDAFKDISELLGPAALFAIGKSIPRHAKFPPGISTISDALSLLDSAYHLNHRGGEIGSYEFTQTDDRSGVVRCHNPYPCDFDRGVITGTVDTFKPAHMLARVRHDDKRPCRRKGGETCTYLVNWCPLTRG
jgi:hypothetical protein